MIQNVDVNIQHTNDVYMSGMALVLFVTSRLNQDYAVK